MSGSNGDRGAPEAATAASGFKEKPLRALFSASTEPEFSTLVPLLRNVEERGGRWMLIYDRPDVLKGRADQLSPANTHYVHGPGLKRAIDEFAPNIYITAHDGIMLTVAITAFITKRGLPIVYIPHGLIGQTNCGIRGRIRTWKANSISALSEYILFLLRFRLSIWMLRNKIMPMFTGGSPTISWTKAFVYDDGAKAALSPLVHDTDRIIVTGHPRLDAVSSTCSGDARETIRRDNGIRPDEKLVLFLSQPFMEDNMISRTEWEGIIGMIRELGHLPKVRVLLRPHPRERVDKYDSSLLEGLAITPPSYSLVDSICACDATLTVNSTAALEAMAMGKPSFSIRLDIVHGRGAPSLPDCIRQFDDRDDLFAGIRDLTIGDAGTEHGSTQHQGAIIRIVDLITDLAGAH